jgi:hypothetical protein
MAFVNLPANLQDLFYSITDRVAKLETGPNSAQTTADSAQTTANSAQTDATTAISNANAALAQANIAYTLAGTSLQKDANTITNSNNNMTAINAGGVTVYSGSSMSSGSRVVMNSAGIAGFNSSGSATFSINASTGDVSMTGALFTGGTIYGGQLNINGNCTIDTSGFLTATGATITGIITATSGSFTGSIYAGSGTIGGWTINSTQLYNGSGAFMNGSTGNIGGNTITAFSNILSYGQIVTTSGGYIEAAGYIRALGQLYAAGHITTGSAANGYVNALTGQVARSTASSQRYKHDIVNLRDVPELNPTALYELPVRAFRFNKDYLPETDDRAEVLVPGFIAEEVDAIYPTGADYNNGKVETWNDRMIIPAILALVQDQNQRIIALEAK